MVHVVNADNLKEAHSIAEANSAWPCSKIYEIDTMTRGLVFEE